jgi:hypothetical protein
MKQLTTTQRYVIITLLLALGIGMRLLPHAPNLTPITAIAFVSAIYLGGRFAFILPIGAMMLSDLFIGMYDVRIMASVYISFLIIATMSLIAKKLKQKVHAYYLVIGASLSFFLITNTAVWFFSPWYEKSMSGLFYAYELGLPFYRNMLIGDIMYTTALIGVFELIIFIQRSDMFQCKYVRKQNNVVYEV